MFGITENKRYYSTQRYIVVKITAMAGSGVNTDKLRPISYFL